MALGLLSESELFGSLDESRVKRLSSWCRGVGFSEGDIVFRQGEDAGDLFVVQSGMVVLELEMPSTTDRPAQQLPIEVITRGECFGWSAIVEPYTYTLTARCQANTTALAIKGARLRDMMADDLELGCRVTMALAQVIARRLTDTRLRLTNGLGLVLYPAETKAAD